MGTFRAADKLLKTRDFRRVYENRVSFRSGPLVLSVAPNGLGVTRIGFVVSARTAPLATRRNFIKRLLREVYRRNKPRFKRGLDLVVIVKSDPRNAASYFFFEELLSGLARKARIIA